MDKNNTLYDKPNYEDVKHVQLFGHTFNQEEYQLYIYGQIPRHVLNVFGYSVDVKLKVKNIDNELFSTLDLDSRSYTVESFLGKLHFNQF